MESHSYLLLTLMLCHEVHMKLQIKHYRKTFGYSYLYYFTNGIWEYPYQMLHQEDSIKPGITVTLFHTILTFNPFENRSCFKTWLEKEKMMVTTVFSFSHNVFKSFFKVFKSLNCVVKGYSDA